VGEAHYKPLAGKRVVVTRAAEQCQSLVDALRAAGAEPVVLPVVAFQMPEDVAVLDDCLKTPGQFDWVFLTSQNAVRALQERWATLALRGVDVFSGARVAAVGPATAEAARTAGLQVACVSQVHNGMAMAKELAAEVRGKRVLLPRSDRANPGLIKTLEGFGATVTAVVAYKTIVPEPASPESEASVFHDRADAVLFYSPSAVHQLRSILGMDRFVQLSRKAVFVAIGPVSEQALKEEGVERVLTATDTTVTASIAAMAEFFNKAGQQQPAGAKQG
jgi:uroporphyrinogen-III synthase